MRVSCNAPGARPPMPSTNYPALQTARYLSPTSLCRACHIVQYDNSIHERWVPIAADGSFEFPSYLPEQTREHWTQYARYRQEELDAYSNNNEENRNKTE